MLKCDCPGNKPHVHRCSKVYTKVVHSPTQSAINTSATMDWKHPSPFRPAEPYRLPHHSHCTSDHISAVLNTTCMPDRPHQLPFWCALVTTNQASPHTWNLEHNNTCGPRPWVTLCRSHGTKADITGAWRSCLKLVTHRRSHTSPPPPASQQKGQSLTRVPLYDANKGGKHSRVLTTPAYQWYQSFEHQT